MGNRMASRVLIIDDDTDVLHSLKMYFKIHFEEVVTSSSPHQINTLFNQHRFDLVLLDMNFRQGHNDGKEGLYWLKHLLQLDDGLAVILLTAYGSIDLAVESLKLGAMDFVVKPWDNQKLLSTALRALELQRSKKKIAQLKTSNKQQNRADENPVQNTKSPAMQAVLNIAVRAAATDATLLIRGENGTGKELMARYIHAMSHRHGEPFVKVDLGALPENLIEAELFGAKKGAFTDAKEDRQGRFEAADEGTIFLDEIGNMSLSAQQKLLSVLQNRQLNAVGSSQAVTVDVRVLCATNAPLEQSIASGGFREDLFYRINTIELHLPPLRERIEDLEDLAEHFLQKFNMRYHRKCTINNTALAKLKEYSWPGNIRELEHCLERAVILSDEPVLDVHQFALDNAKIQERQPANLNYSLEELEAAHIAKVMEHYSGNISKTAAHLKINRNTLYKKIEKYGL